MSKDGILNSLNFVLGISNNIYSKTMFSSLLDPITKLQYFKDNIEKNEEFSCSNSDIKKFVNPIRDSLITVMPVLKNQCELYWDSLCLMNAKINQRKKFNKIRIFDHDKLPDMGLLNTYHVEAITKFLDNPNELTNLLSLCYCHVIRIEIFEKPIKYEYEQLLEKYNLTRIFNANKIFSVKNIALTKTRNKESQITDVRAVRNCLAHFLYKISDEPDWKIEFIGGSKQSDQTIYSEIFTKEKFVEFMNNSNILYQLLISLGVICSAIVNLKEFSLETLRLLPRNNYSKFGF